MIARTVDVCSLCGAHVETDATGPCCAGARFEQVELLPAATLLGVSRAPVLGPVTVAAPSDDEVRQVLRAAEDRSRVLTSRIDRILRAVCERLLFGAVIGALDRTWRGCGSLSAADYERVMAMSDVALRAHVAAHLRGAQAQPASAS